MNKMLPGILSLLFDIPMLSAELLTEFILISVDNRFTVSKKLKDSLAVKLDTTINSLNTNISFLLNKSLIHHCSYRSEYLLSPTIFEYKADGILLTIKIRNERIVWSVKNGIK